MTTTSALTDSYIEAVLRRLPARQRPDIDRELRASIADAVDARVADGEDPAEAERSVLTGLGDPATLAAGYADRPFYLIGPELYLDYIRLLTTLVAIVVPIVAGLVGISAASRGEVITAIIGSVIGASITAGVHVAFWTTLVFAALQRIPAQQRIPGRQRSGSRPWTVANLPQPPSRRARYAELVTLSAVLVVFTTAILLSPVVSPETDVNGDPIGILNPWLWDTGIVYVFIGLVILSLGNAFAKYYGPKRPSLAIAGALVDIAPAIVLVWLASTQRLLNPAFVEAAGWQPAMRWVELGVLIAAALSVLSAIGEAVRRVRRP